jgi:hypothetical protein
MIRGLAASATIIMLTDTTVTGMKSLINDTGLCCLRTIITLTEITVATREGAAGMEDEV